VRKIHEPIDTSRFGAHNEFHENGGMPEKARSIAQLKGSLTRKLHDRTEDRASLDEIERISA